uniref:Protein kinase domain-containing protein n=1 Tax=Grammatophora oceanica TaxID=210454 RepID=A0A7S1VQJ0_9STRA|mmetsp:Transcript_5319/g.7431  ORF Transcript_5319/g.7431 Transcript_5319/m.7431 type:complete len:450 (+) Transcript_5319:382-1731(+)|eukprot:CAMPEP_0194029348 /NCGR_PEP_ID=MMETSP0009_2-20130614/3090_1 /TAXON_ID=210454 /ORGANISM="Grammatophora oceanica, Strain CCMP 410" /LENGTH=449 /DNA_ID=CAMNT_0038668979 /DNA_START=331 /DNA_END=1680 /DNA_ORIENTATION=-
MSRQDIAPHARLRFSEVEAAGDAVRPLDFPPPVVARGVRVNALVVHPESGARQVCSGVIHREDLSPLRHQEGMTPPPSPLSPASEKGADCGSSVVSVPNTSSSSIATGGKEPLAYWPQRRLQNAIYGSVWACLVLKRHYGVAADDAARAAGVEPGSPDAPIVWEITGNHVAIKMVEWARFHHHRGRLLEDPVKEVAAMQLVGTQHPNVLGSSEVLQDNDFLYSIMPFCRGGDLFGVVVEYAEQSGGEIGMPEPVARYWFRQILWGLHHLQSMGVCHRDLSLENVLVDDDRCMIIDMGMCLRIPYNDSLHEGHLTDVRQGSVRRLMRPQGTCGKHNYMSPEVAANIDCFDGFSIDLWAAGVILYIMLTGFPPYDQANVTDQRFELIVTGRLMEQLRNWDINLSEEAGDLLQKMLQLEPRERLNLAEIFAHPWVVKDEVEPPPPMETLPYH